MGAPLVADVFDACAGAAPALHQIVDGRKGHDFVVQRLHDEERRHGNLRRVRAEEVVLHHVAAFRRAQHVGDVEVGLGLLGVGGSHEAQHVLAQRRGDDTVEARVARLEEVRLADLVDAGQKPLVELWVGVGLQRCVSVARECTLPHPLTKPCSTPTTMPATYLPWHRADVSSHLR
jgi:hypothetical protein